MPSSSRSVLGVTAPSSSSATLPVLDAPAWPAATTKLLLTWVVYPVVMRPATGGAEVPTRQIELVIRAGEVARRFRTELVSGVFYATATQRRCQHPTSFGKRVAELYLNGGANLVLAVDRDSDGLVLTREVSSDGLCQPSPCPIERTPLARIRIPSHAALEERFHVVEDGQREHDARE